jgi:hypothetical protein
VCCPAVGNNIGDAGATALAAALQKNTTVTEVELSGARACWGVRVGPRAFSFELPLRVLRLGILRR